MDPQTRQKLTLLTAMKGAPLSIFLVLVIAGRGMLAQELETWTGYGHEAIGKGLRKLAHLGAVHDRGRRAGYVLNPGWHQLELFRPLLVDNLDPPVDNFGKNEFDFRKSELNPHLTSENQNSNRDHDHDDDDDLLVDKLETLAPPFTDAAYWLKYKNNALVAAWLDHFDNLPAKTRAAINNQSAFIRAKVNTGRLPPQPRPKKPDLSRYTP